jgi:hypothetical protein
MLAEYRGGLNVLYIGANKGEVSAMQGVASAVTTNCKGKVPIYICAGGVTRLVYGKIVVYLTSPNCGEHCSCGGKPDCDDLQEALDDIEEDLDQQGLDE